MKLASRFSKGFFYLALLPVTVGICAWQGWAWWSWASAPVQPSETPATPARQTIQIEVPQGATAQQIGELLKSAGLIKDLNAWNLWTRWQSLQNREGSFQAGNYEISPTDSLSTIADKIWRGEVIQSSFTIPEGWSIEQMADYFAERGYFSKEAFLAAAQQIPREQYPWLPENLPHLEGFLYPDTYQFGEQLTPEATMQLMLDRFQQVALPLYQQAQGKTSYTLLEWVTLASIVEKEAVVGAERPQIASVFAKRLRENIALGADPTVEYALGIRQTPDQPLTYDQVQVDSPYNTYVKVGLPPTPIASPGVASLEVSLAPAETEYLYFVARYDGTHIFSKTLAEHEAAQAQIHDGRAEQSRPDSSPGASPSSPGPAGTTLSPNTATPNPNPAAPSPTTAAPGAP
jgi:UPF0755 protein